MKDSEWRMRFNNFKLITIKIIKIMTTIPYLMCGFVFVNNSNLNN